MPHRRVLICDDSASFRALLQVQLRLPGDLSVVGEAADGQEAVDGVLALDPDVLLLDIDMPGRTGLDALPEIRSVAPGTRVLMLTADDSPAAVNRAAALGAHGFLKKGVPADDLVGAIRAA